MNWGTLEALMERGALGAMDLHFARLMARLGGDEGWPFLAAAALASRRTAEGHVCLPLAEAAGRPLSEDLPDSATPSLPSWLATLRESSVVGVPGDFRPLVLDGGGRLYLYRYWDYERRLADNLVARANAVPPADEALLRDGLERLFPNSGEADWQQIAAATAVLRRFAVISGGPGTGKTTTVLKVVALLLEQPAPRPLRVALAAPTGKAAARLAESIRTARDRVAIPDALREYIPTEATTLHRLLGYRPDGGFARGPERPLALDCLIVDEASMVGLPLMERLVGALPPTARLILLGDKDQLASVEPGAVLAEICGPGRGFTSAFGERLARLVSVPAAAGGGEGPLADTICLLHKSYRFRDEGGIGKVARLVNGGQGEEALAALRDGDGLEWRAIGDAEALESALSEAAREHYGAYGEALRAGRGRPDPFDLLDKFQRFRVLCAVREGPFGVAGVNAAIERALRERGLIGSGQWYAGRPVMVVRNDYGLQLFNGDIGIALPKGDGLRVFFPSPDGGFRDLPPSRLPEHETVFAMTVHKSQGSEFDRVLLLLPAGDSPVLSRELIYTALTRARTHAAVWGRETVFTEAVSRRLARASGLGERLWGGF